ncbi:DUF2391 family protein [Candidatus Woesearchaeota archaeon]|nr:DUF2391 family protein [Candidatus Woesearchaeota archaeon]
MTTKQIEEDVKTLKERLLEPKPERFSARDIVRAFFGALFIGVTFVFSGRLMEVVQNMHTMQMFLVIIATIIILIAEIYFIGWSRLKRLKEPGRNVFEFTFKRVVVAYVVSLIVALFYMYVLGLDNMLSSIEIAKFVFVFAMPCSVGAAVADLLRKY